MSVYGSWIMDNGVEIEVGEGKHSVTIPYGDTEKQLKYKEKRIREMKWKQLSQQPTKSGDE